jgi:archaellum component FlaC
MEDKYIQEILERIVRIETKIDGYNSMHDKVNNTSQTVQVLEEKVKNLEAKVKTIEDNLTWLWRTIAAVIIVGAITASIKFL